MKKTSQSIILNLRHMMQKLDYYSKKLNKNYGLTIPQIICLYELFEHGSLNIAELSKRVYLSSSTLVGVIDRLEEKQFIVRTREPKDRRIIHLAITEKTKEFLSSSPELLNNKLANYLNSISTEEQKNLAGSISMVLTMIDYITSSTIDPLT